MGRDSRALPPISPRSLSPGLEGACSPINAIHRASDSARRRSDQQSPGQLTNHDEQEAGQEQIIRLSSQSYELLILCLPITAADHPPQESEIKDSRRYRRPQFLPKPPMPDLQMTHEQERIVHVGSDEDCHNGNESDDPHFDLPYGTELR